MSRPAWLVLVAAALLLLATVSLPIACGAVDSIYILRLLYSDSEADAPSVTALWNGIRAAMYAGGDVGSNNRPIIIVEKEVSESMSDVVAIVERAIAQYPTLLTILAPFTGTALTSLLASDVVKNNNLVSFAPNTPASSVRTWSPYVYFTRPDPNLALLQLLDYALNTLRVIRVGLMYLDDSGIGPTEYELATKQMRAASKEPPVLYCQPVDDTLSLNESAFDTMADKDVQAVFIFGTPGKQTRDFVTRCLTDPRTSSAILLGPSMLLTLMHQTYIGLANAGTITYEDNHIINCMSNVLPNVDSFTHVKLFQTEMTNYIANSGASDYSDSSYYLTNLTLGVSMLGGWIAGKVLMQTLLRQDWVASASAYMTGLFQQNRYLIGGDYLLGDYAGPCNAALQQQGAMCSCNQGGHTAFLSAIINREHVYLNASLTYPTEYCYAASYTIATPLNFILFNFTDAKPMVDAADLFHDLTDNVALTGSYADQLSFNYVTLNVSVSGTSAQTALDTYLATHSASIIRGPFSKSLSTTLFVLEPFYTKASITVEERNAISIRPTIDQYFYIVMGNMDKLGLGAFTVVLRGYDSSETSALRSSITKTADTFNEDEPSIVSITDTDHIFSALDSTGLSMLLGMGTGMAAEIASFLTANPSAYIVLGAQDFYIYYTEMVEAFSPLPSSVQNRLLFLTNLPLWTDTSDEAHAASDALTAYHETAPTPYSPISFELYVMTWFVESVVSNLEVINSTNMLNIIYRNGVIAAKDIVLGSYRWTCNDTDTTSTNCTRRNYGARSIVMMSMHRVFDPSVPLVLNAITPSMTYTARTPSNKLTSQQLAGIIAGSVVGGLLLIAMVLLFVFCCISRGRNNDTAPKKAEEPVTIVFTDIESSTALWAALPQLMPDAVAAHHRLIRQLLKKYDCYEVKTIGDSFMIACKDATSAVKLASDIQVKLLKYDWKTTLIDESYRRFELQKQEDDPEYKPPTAELNLDVYAALWNGLRVRMGIHTGLSDIRYDEVTKGYDYYGDTSNMAARTEAIANGGQVIMTEATWWALSTEERGEMNFRGMGAQGLRGVPYAVEMYQLNPVLGRQYADLRTEIEAVLPDDTFSESGASAADALLSSHAAMSGPSHAVAYVLSGCFSPYPTAQRVRELQPLLTKWNVAAPPRSRGVSEEDYCQGLINRLAVRVATVAQARQALNGDIPAQNPFAHPTRPSTQAGSTAFANSTLRERCSTNADTASLLHNDPSTYDSRNDNQAPLPGLQRFRKRSEDTVRAFESSKASGAELPDFTVERVMHATVNPPSMENSVYIPLVPGARHT